MLLMEFFLSSLFLSCLVQFCSCLFFVLVLRRTDAFIITYFQTNFKVLRVIFTHMWAAILLQKAHILSCLQTQSLSSILSMKRRTLIRFSCSNVTRIAADPRIASTVLSRTNVPHETRTYYASETLRFILLLVSSQGALRIQRESGRLTNVSLAISIVLQ